jgi:hypothetical protein
LRTRIFIALSFISFDNKVARQKTKQGISPMLSRETLEEYRRMTPGERFALALTLTEDSAPYLSHGTPEQVARKFELLHRENDERNRRMLEAIARTKRPS